MSLNILYKEFDWSSGNLAVQPQTGVLQVAGVASSVAVSGSEPSWTNSADTELEFFTGTLTRDLTTHIDNFDSNLHVVQHDATSTALPAWLSLDPSGVLTAEDGAPTTDTTGIRFKVLDNAEADWQARATAAGVTFAYDMGDQVYYGGQWNTDANFFSTHKYANGMDATELSRLYQETTDGPAGRCMRSDYVAGDNKHTQAIVVPFNGTWTSPNQGIGTTQYYISFRFKVPAGGIPEIYGSGGDSWKWFLIGQYNQDPVSPVNSYPYSPSHVESTFALEDTGNRDFPAGYHYGVGGQLFILEDSDGPAPYFYKKQNAIDNGAGLPVNERYCLYGTDYAGCFHWPKDRWMTFKLRIKIAQYGAVNAGNEFDAWIADQDATAWTLIMSHTNLSVGAQRAEWPGGLNGLHLTGYQTGRTGSAADFWFKWAQVIVSTNDIALPGVGA